MANEDNPDYPVGFGKPPRHTRFRQFKRQGLAYAGNEAPMIPVTCVINSGS
jgi:hypothetical protein